MLQKLEDLQRDLHFQLGRTLFDVNFDVAKEETATAAAPKQETVTLVPPPLLGRLWKNKDLLAYSTAAVSCLFGGLWCFKMCDGIFNDKPKSIIAIVAAAASAIVALSAMPPPPQPPSPALSAKRRLLDHFVPWFINQISNVPNGCVTIFKKLAPEFLARLMPTFVSSRISWPLACVVGLVFAWPCINWFIGCWLITGFYNFFFYSSTECKVEFTVEPGQCILMEFDAHGLQIDFDVSSTQHNDEAAANSSASTGTLLSAAGLVSVWICSALLVPFPEKISCKGIDVRYMCKGLMFAVSALFWWYGSQTSTSCDVQRTLLRRQSCMYDLVPVVNFEEHPVQLQLRVLFTYKTSVFAEPKNIELKSSYHKNFDSYKELLRWREDSRTASEHRIWTPRSSLHPIISWIAQSFVGWIACAVAFFIAHVLYNVVPLLLQGSGNEQTPTSSQGQSTSSWSWSSCLRVVLYPAKSVATLFWPPPQTNGISSAGATSTGPQPSSTSSSYLGSSLSYVGGWARWFGGGCANLGQKSVTFVKDSTLYIGDRCIVTPVKFVWQNRAIKAIVAYGVWTHLKELFSKFDPIWGMIGFFHVNVAFPVGKRLMTPVFEHMTLDTPCIDLASRTDKLNEHIMAIGNTQLTFQL